jgi:four helix bundle protein
MRIGVSSFNWGSLPEVLTQLEIAAALGYITDTEMAEAEIKGRELLRVISGLCDSMKP